MSAIALVILALLWAAVLVPDLIQRTHERSRSDSIGSFARQRSTLSQSVPVGHSRPLEPTVPGRPRPAVRATRSARISPATAKRRQDVVAGLVAAALLTFLGAVSVGGFLVVANVLVDVLLVGYLGLLLFVTRRAQQRANVTVLYPRHEQMVVPMADRRQRIAR